MVCLLSMIRTQCCEKGQKQQDKSDGPPKLTEPKKPLYQNLKKDQNLLSEISQSKISSGKALPHNYNKNRIQ